MSARTSREKSRDRKSGLSRANSDKKGLAGAKPPTFCDWVFDLLGATGEDELDDLFPGTGVVTARWKARQGRLEIA